MIWGFFIVGRVWFEVYSFLVMIDLRLIHRWPWLIWGFFIVGHVWFEVYSTLVMFDLKFIHTLSWLIWGLFIIVLITLTIKKPTKASQTKVYSAPWRGLAESWGDQHDPVHRLGLRMGHRDSLGENTFDHWIKPTSKKSIIMKDTNWIRIGWDGNWGLPLLGSWHWLSPVCRGAFYLSQILESTSLCFVGWSYSNWTCSGSPEQVLLPHSHSGDVPCR